MKAIDNCSIRSVVTATALSIGLGLVTNASAKSYLVDLNSRTATELGTLGGDRIYPSAINEAGRVAGTSSSYRFFDAFITGPNGVGMTDLGALPGLYHSSANGINNAGQVVGESDSSTGSYCCNDLYDERAFITGPNGVGMTDLGTLGGRRSTAFGVNDAGQVVGYSDTADGSHHAFITAANGVGMADLGKLPGVNSSIAYGINDAGQVVGNSYAVSGSSRAFITGANGAGMTDLGTLGGGYSSAKGINDAGQVMGYSTTADGSNHAFITGPNGVGMTDLGTLGGDSSYAYGINDAGQVVGYSDTADGSNHAFITGPNGVGMTDLNSLVHLPDGLVMDPAFAINNMGQVTVSAFGPVIIPAVPEPEPYALMLAGLVLTGVMARRKQKAGAREEVAGL